MRDIVFLFGAGASHGAGGIIPEKPPLGSALFSELARIHSGSWGSLPGPMKAMFGDNFEKGMAEVYQQAGVAIPQLMREMAIYFAQFRPVTSDCLYRRLVRDLKGSRMAQRSIFSTLNYECALEFSLNAEGETISYFEQEPVKSWPTWKLHGSCNFFSKELQASPGVFFGTGVIVEGGIQALPSIDDVLRHCLVETALAPVMNLYMQGKPLAVSPSVIRQIQAWWTQAILSASKVVVVGVYPNMEDDHLWKPLSETQAQLLFIGAEKAFQDWLAAHRQNHSLYLGSRFSDSYDKLISNLSSP